MKRNEQKTILRERINALQAAMDAEQAAADEIENGALWETEQTRIFAKYQPQIENLWKWLSALSYPVAKAGWFRDVFCESFKTGYNKISYRQEQIFLSHCESISRNDFPHCVAGNRVFIVIPGKNRLHVERLPEI